MVRLKIDNPHLQELTKFVNLNFIQEYIFPERVLFVAILHECFQHIDGLKSLGCSSNIGNAPMFLSKTNACISFHLQYEKYSRLKKLVTKSIIANGLPCS
jgi:hypothetical protein